MNCYQHPGRDAIGICIECSNPVCAECKVEYAGRIYCNTCIERKIGGTVPATQVAGAAFENTSGMGSKATAPPGLGEWNWGGLLLTFIWGIGNNVWWSFLVFVPYLGLVVIPFLLAFKGNEWAWQSKHWESVEHFKRVQHTWAVWGWALTIAVTVLVVSVMVTIALMLIAFVQQEGLRLK